MVSTASTAADVSNGRNSWRVAECGVSAVLVVVPSKKETIERYSSIVVVVICCNATFG